MNNNYIDHNEFIDVLNNLFNEKWLIIILHEYMNNIYRFSEDGIFVKLYKRNDILSKNDLEIVYDNNINMYYLMAESDNTFSIVNLKINPLDESFIIKSYSVLGGIIKKCLYIDEYIPTLYIIPEEYLKIFIDNKKQLNNLKIRRRKVSNKSRNRHIKKSSKRVKQIKRSRKY